MTSVLLVIDVQIAVVEQAHDRDRIVARIADVVSRARQSGCPVIWVRHHDEGLPSNTPAWTIVPELVPMPDESVIDKSFPDAFEDTELLSVLSRVGASRLFVTGAQTDFCIRSTLHGAIARGFDAVLVSDCHTTDDKSFESGTLEASRIIEHTNFWWHWHRSATNSGGTVASSHIEFENRTGIQSE